MGFDINRFRESETKEEFICPICHDILEDPILLEECEHVFCSQCINQWLQKCEQKLCPIDRQEICDKSLRPPQRSFRNLITSLLISCDFQSNGCQQWIKIEELTTHSTNCAFNPVIMNQDIDCPSDCGAIVKRCGSIDEHNCVAFLKKIIDNNNDCIQKLSNENKVLFCENNRLKTETNKVKTKYEESIKQLELLCTENKNFSIDLSNNKQKLSVLNEKYTKLNESNYSKDITIDVLKTEIQNLKTKNEKLVQMLRISTKSESVSSYTQNDCLDLMSFESSGNVMNSDERDCNEISITTSVENRQLITALSKRNILVNKRVVRAMLSIDRGLFAPSAASYALHHIRSIGYGAHTGPATYEATLLQYLEPHLSRNCKVLDIGSGTGYLTACIASMIGTEGVVIGIEHIVQLVQQSVETIDKHYPKLRQSGVLKMYLSDGRFGYSPEAPYDLIFIEPLTRRVPQKLIDQCRPGGSIVVPIGAREKDISLELFTKQMNGEVVRLVLSDDWKLMQENTPDLFEDKKMQMRTGWKVKLGF